MVQLSKRRQRFLIRLQNNKAQIGMCARHQLHEATVEVLLSELRLGGSPFRFELLCCLPLLVYR